MIRREIEIRQFRPVTFFTPMILWQHENGGFLTKWQPRDFDGVDQEGRIVEKDIAERILMKVKNTPAQISGVEQTKGTHLQRLPYSLSALQIDAGKLFGYSPQDVLDTQQALYENLRIKKRF